MKNILYYFLLLMLNSCAVYNFENYVTVNEVSLYQEKEKDIITEQIPAHTKISLSPKNSSKGYAVYYKNKRWYLIPRYYEDVLSYFDYCQKYKTHPSNDLSYDKPVKSYKSSSPNSSVGTVKVKGYYRKNGTYVRPHTRSAPKKRY